MKIHTLAFVGSLMLPPLTTGGPQMLHAATHAARPTSVADDFNTRKNLLKGTDYFAVFNKNLSAPQRQALEFLYSYMPLPDITDYSGEFYLMNVDYSLRAREEMPWGKTVPEREFRHFVLPVRINNENLDESRRVFYEELKDRVRGLSMYEAVLEVNHWCHEKVTYTPSDSRTSSPLASVRTAYGRCGEESTFTVAALRSVGIPARQVYTPRWAHTDDNHAWVEAWVDGKWYFLGACEPEPVLNLGWFNAPASRGMLMHTKVFGKYDGPEDVMSRTPCFTEINVTTNYAPTSRIVVRTTDQAGKPIEADVSFRLYNYAEFYTVSQKKTDKNGIASLETGRGDLIVWASKGDKFGLAKGSVGKDDTITVQIDKDAHFTGTIEFDIVPPVERNTQPHLTAEQTRRNVQRMAYEDSLRNAYVSTFMTAEQATEFAQSVNLDKEAVTRVMKESRGNYATLRTFLSETPDNERKRALRLLQVISDKDRRDVPADVLADHMYLFADSVRQHPLYDHFILNPRVSNEMLTPYKAFFAKAIPADNQLRYRKNPELWAEWCKKNIHTEEVWNPQLLCMHPQSVWKLRKTDPHSRDIFFVSVARSMGIAARIDEVTGKTQYADAQGNWHDVLFEEQKNKSSEQGSLKATYAQAGRLDDPKYYSHFTLSKLTDGKPQLMNFAESATWSNLLKNGTQLDAGQYMLISGTRMANGSVLARVTFFPVEKNKENNVQLAMRESKDGVQVIGNFNSENLYYDLQNGQNKSLLSTTGRGYYVIGLITPNHEPTNHALRDIALYRKELEKWGRSIVVLFKDKDEAQRFHPEEFQGLPKNTIFGTDIDENIEKEIKAAMKLSNGNKPVFLIADTFNRVVYISQGYTIGLGEQLLKVIHKLSE